VKLFKKKELITFLVVSLILGTLSVAYADGLGAIGTKLQATVFGLRVRLDGRQILDRIIVIDGTSYLPVRKVSELLGIDVYYNSFTQDIELRDNQPTTVEPTLSHGRYIAEVKFTYDNGTVYDGGYRNGMFQGKGKIIYADGTIYDGHFINGVLEGHGKYTALNGDKYEGIFKNNVYDGFGKYTYANGDVVEGEFKDDKLVSEFVYVRIKATGERLNIKSKEWDRPFRTVDVYDKTFIPYKYNGTAKIWFENGDHYDGEITDNYFNGKGTMVYQNYSEYDGNWVKNRKTGYGTFTYSNGSIYKGYFLNDKYNGEGTFYYTNGDRYDGAWENGLRVGYGKYTEANGNYFKGLWKDDNKHTLEQTDDKDFYGYGTYIIESRNTADGKRITLKQKWENGKLKRVVVD